MSSLTRFVLPLHCFAAFVALAAATGLARAEANPNSDSVLGQRYLEVLFGTTQYQGIGKLELHGGATLQIPIVNHLDADVTYLRSDWRPSVAGGFFAEHFQTDTASADVTTYTNIGKVRIFGGAGLYRQWQHEAVSYAGSPIFDQRSQTDYWVADAGLEVSVYHIVVTPSVGYTDALSHEWYNPPQSGVVTYELEAHRWFTRRIGAFVAVSYSDPQWQYSPTATSYLAGVRTRF